MHETQRVYREREKRKIEELERAAERALLIESTLPATSSDDLNATLGLARRCVHCGRPAEDGRVCGRCLADEARS